MLDIVICEQFYVICVIILVYWGPIVKYGGIAEVHLTRYVDLGSIWINWLVCTFVFVLGGQFIVNLSYLSLFGKLKFGVGVY